MPHVEERGTTGTRASQILERDPSDDVTSVRRKAATFGGRPDDPTFVETMRDFARRYGWRAYALPILVVITIGALLTMTRGTDPSQTTKAVGGTSQSSTPPPATDTTLPPDAPGAGSIDTVVSAAALPPGAKYTKQGTGTFHIVSGHSTAVVGSGPLFKYTVDVEDGITGVDTAKFASLVQATLADKRSWSGHGISLQRVDSGFANFHVTLTSSMTVRSLCGYDIPIETSCYAATSATSGAQIDRVVLNVSRWVRGDANYIGDLNAYRVYMINHEDGHALGHQHAHSCLAGGLAPVMMQQTIGLKSAVTGKICAANPWPFPKGAKGAPGPEAPDTPENSEIQIGND